MWRNPQIATDVFATAVMHFYLENPKMLQVRFSPMPEHPVYRMLCDWTNRINVRMTTAGCDEPSFRRWYHRFIVKETQALEKKKQFALLSELALCIHQTETLFGDRTPLTPTVRELWSVLATQVILLIGQESRTLVGTRDNVPAWRSVAPIKKVEIPDAMLRTYFANYTALQHVGKDEAWMVPTWREFDLDTYRAYEAETTYMEVTRELFESAFYRQRYVIDPNGVYVKVTNARNVTGLYLKVKPRSGSELADILVRAETEAGAVFFVLTEKVLVENSLDMTYFCPGSYLACLASQVYHDLVTATVASDQKTLRSDSLGGTFAPSESKEASWTVIPRKIRNVVREPRIRVAERTINEPRRVTGHLRKGRMTEAHREVLQQFERETGLDVLRFIPEGYTFVRPHISPRTSHEDIAALPRFIRYRIQQSLEAALKSQELRR